MDLWQEFVKKQEHTMGKETTQKWLSPLKVIKLDNTSLILEAKDAFQALWLEEHMRHKIDASFKNAKGRPLKVKIQLAPSNIIAQEALFDESRHKQSKDLHFSADAIDPYALFPQFVVTKESEVAFGVLAELAGFDPKSSCFRETSSECPLFNPVFIHGPKGSGKSHLLMATAKALSRRGQRVFYVRAESFTEHVIYAMRSSKMETFRRAYRHVDALIIDDVHLFARKKATQEELFHTFNTLHTQGKQIILSATTTPRLLQEVEDRLISRFEWGISLGIERAMGQDLRKILIGRSELIRFPLQPEIVTYILDNFSTPSAVLKALDTLVLRSHLSHKERLNIGLAKSYLGDLIAEENKESLSTKSILKMVAEVFGIKTEDILGKSQCREFVLPRQIAMYLCREKLKMPYTKIGAFFARDHSTVMTSVRSITKSLSNQDKEVTSCLSDIQRKVVNL